MLPRCQPHRCLARAWGHMGLGPARTSVAPSGRAARRPQGSLGRVLCSTKERDGPLPQVHHTLHTARVQTHSPPFLHYPYARHPGHWHWVTVPSAHHTISSCTLLLGVLAGAVVAQHLCALWPWTRACSTHCVCSQLRDQKHSIEEDTRKYCLICGQEASLFDRCVEGGFRHHVKETHNMWQYLYFMVYLDIKPDDEYTGIATH